MNFHADAFAAMGYKHRFLARDLGYVNEVHRPCHAPGALGLLILAAGGAQNRLKPGLRTPLGGSLQGSESRLQAVGSRNENCWESGVAELKSSLELFILDGNDPATN